MKLNLNGNKISLREGGISKRPGWPYLIDCGMHVEGVLGGFISDEDRRIDSCRDLNLFKKRIYPKMLKELDLPALLTLLLSYQTLHHIIYTELVINFTNAVGSLKEFNEVISSVYYSLKESSENTGGLFSIVPELDTSVEETVFMKALEYSCSLHQKNWIKGVCLVRRGENSIGSYYKKLSETNLFLALDFTTKIEKSRFLDEISISGVRRIHYNARLEDLLDDLRKKKIAVQISPTADLAFYSNFSLVDYPFVDYFRKGYKTVVSSGYPELTSSSIENELVLLKSSFGLSVEEIAALSEFSAESAFCDDVTRETILEKLRIKN